MNSITHSKYSIFLVFFLTLSAVACDSEIPDSLAFCLVMGSTDCDSPDFEVNVETNLDNSVESMNEAATEGNTANTSIATIGGTEPIEIVPAVSGFHLIDIPSSTDGANLESSIYLPPDYSADNGTYPLIMFINGSQGKRGQDVEAWLKTEADKRGWIAVTSSGRQWDLNQKYGCFFTTAMAYLDHSDPSIGSDETDRLDVIDWVRKNYNIDENRIYLTGFSLGGRGVYQIGLRNPDIFAGIAPLAPAVDLFEVDIYTSPSRTSYACRMAVAGGVPGTSLLTRTRRHMSSARFLVENAFNLPIFHGHGDQDGLVNNIKNNPTREYTHGYHLTVDNSFNGVYEYEDKLFDFGHTPTLSELHELHPDGYDFAFMFTDNAHNVDSRWIFGTELAPEVNGVIDVQDENRYIGAMEFLASKTRNTDPDTVFYKSYTDKHKRSYWLAIDIESPWQAIPGAVNATRDKIENTLNLQLANIDSVTIDMDSAGLIIGKSGVAPLRIEVNPMNNDTYDPALKSSSFNSKLIFTGNFSGLTENGVEVRLDGQAVDQADITLTNSVIELTRISASSSTSLLISGL